MKKKGLKSPTLFDVMLAIILGLFALIILYPFYNAILISIITESEYIRTQVLLYPQTLSFASYAYLFKDGTLFNGMKVTTIITIVGVIYNMLLTVLCSYVLTKPFPGRKFVSWAIIFTMYFSGGLIPYYLLIKDLNLMNNIFSMILPTGITFMYMTVIRRNIESIPPSIEESARIDGANDLTILFRIILPLSLPILATFVLYYAVDRWNEWWNGMLFIKSTMKQPLQLLLRNLVQDASQTNATAADMAGAATYTDGIKMAGTVISMLPIMLVYPFLQKYFVSGLTVGAVKE